MARTGFRAVRTRTLNPKKPTMMGMRLPIQHPPASMGKPGIGTPAAGGKRPGVGVPAGPGAVAPKVNRPTKPVVGQHASPDSLYYNTVDLADRKQNQQLDQLQGQEQAVQYDFGLTDPTNPFSRANALKNAYLAKYRGVSAGLAAQGQLYSGAHERALARTRLEEEQGRAALRQAFDAAMNSIGSQKAGVQFNTEEEKAAAFQSWLDRAPDAPDITKTAAPTAKTSSTAPAPTTKTPPKPVGGTQKLVNALALADAKNPVGPVKRSSLPKRIQGPKVGKSKSLPGGVGGKFGAQFGNNGESRRTFQPVPSNGKPGKYSSPTKVKPKPKTKVRSRGGRSR